MEEVASDSILSSQKKKRKKKSAKSLVHRCSCVFVVAMAAAVSTSLLPITAARALSGSTTLASFAGSYQKKKRVPMMRVRCAADDEEEVNDLGVNVALSMLKFYKREISPLLPSSCRYVPTCSEYSMQAYKRYGVAKGTILTAWRLCRCNPLGGHGYDPPRWFGEEVLPEE